MPVGNPQAIMAMKTGLKPLTVLQVLPALNVGGVERATVETAQALAERGHHSHILSAGGRLVDTLLAQGSQHHQMAVGRKSPLTLLVIGRVRALIRDLRPDLIHVRSRLPAWVIHRALAGISSPQPGLVATVHGAYSVSAYSRIMTRADRVIAVSDFIRRYIVSNYPDAAARIEVIPNGVSPEQFPRGHRPSATWLANWQRDWPRLQGQHLITLPGRLSPAKGHEQFIEVLAGLRRVCPDVHGLVVGASARGSRRQRRFLSTLKRRIDALGLQDHISFLGARSDISEVMAVSSVVLSLSRKPEAFGRTALEALSLGVPVVACDHGGISEILQGLLPEGLVPCGDTSAVCERVLQFLRERPAIRKNTELTLETTLNRTLALYQTVASRPAG